MFPTTPDLMDNHQNEILPFHKWCAGVPKIISNKSKVYKCEICNKILKSETSIINHLQKLHNEKTSREEETSNKPENYKCEICYKIFESGTGIRNHLQKIHNQETPWKEESKYKHKCGICYKTLQSGRAIGNHLQSIHDERVSWKQLTQTKYITLFACKKCGVRYTKDTALESHVSDNHNEIKYIQEFLPCKNEDDLGNIRSILQKACVKCDEKFTSDRIIYALQPGFVRKHPCPKCSSTFKHLISLYDHRARIHDD